MAAERKDQHPIDAFGDIPDPIGGVAPPPSRPIRAPDTPSPTRGEMQIKRLVFLSAAFVWPALMLLYYGGGWRGHGIDFVAAQFTLWAAFLVFAAWLALSAGKRGVGRPVPWLRIAAVGAPLAFVVLALVWLPPNGKPFGEVGSPTMLEGCFEIGLTVAIPMLAFSVWAMRRSFPSGSAWRGAALGAACGLGGVVVLVMLCGSPYGGHIALAHGMPLVIATLVGAWGGRRLGRP